MNYKLGIKNTKFYITITLALLFLCLMLSQSISLAATYFVSLEGNNQWSGTSPEPNSDNTDGPFKTLEKARDTIRQLKRDNKFNQPIDIVLRGGTYFLDKPFELTDEDSGTSTCPIIYKSHPGEKATISGGKIINNTWHKYTDNIYVTDVGTMTFNSLFFDDKRAVRAREPDEDPNTPYLDYFIVDSVDNTTNLDCFDFKGNDIDPSWYDLRNVEVVYIREWTTSRERIDRIEGNTVWFQAQPRYKYWANNRYWVENVFEGLDEPNEWFLDIHTGKLYYYPPNGQDPNNMEIIVPKQALPTRFVPELLHIRAGTSPFVEYVHFKNLTFAYTDWYLPKTGFFGFGGDSFIEECEGSAGGWKGVGPAIIYIRARYCDFIGNEIKHTGGNGLHIFGSNMNILSNEFTDIGGNAVILGSLHGEALSGILTTDNTITDNLIHDIGTVYVVGMGIQVLIADNTLVAHNEVYDVDYMGIHVGAWRPNPIRNNVIEYNNVYRVQRQVGDGAGIYLCSHQIGPIVRNNKVHDLKSIGSEIYPYYAEGGIGLYIDEGGEDIVMRNNWVYRTTMGLLMHAVSTNTITNNVFVDHSYTYSAFNVGGNNKMFKNIIYTKEKKKLFHIVSLNVNESDYNIYYNPEATNYSNELDSWKSWKGFEEHSLCDDPLFVDYPNDNFNLLLNSPAFGLGFERIDMNNVGPRPKDTPEILTGDLNIDGKVDAQDLQAFINHFLGKQDWGSQSDVNRDGNITRDDFEEIMTIILEIKQ